MNVNINGDNTSENEYLVTNKKSNLFNIVIGIATLLIAILGATFAYFSATASSEQNDVNLKSAYLSISYNGGTKIVADELIPSAMYIALNRFQRPTFENVDDPEADYGPRCIDSRGNQVCYVYQFAITSELEGGTTDIVGYINVEENGFENLSYLLYKVDFARDADGAIIMDEVSWEDKGETITQVVERVSNYSPVENNFTETVMDPEIEDESGVYWGRTFAKFLKPQDLFDEETGAPAGTLYPVACLFGYANDYESKEVDDPARCASYQITNGADVEHVFQLVVWLQETGTNQLEQKKNFAGTVKIDVAGGTNSTGYEDGHVTGTLD